MVSITSTEDGNTIFRAITSLGPKMDRIFFRVLQELFLLLSMIFFNLILEKQLENKQETKHSRFMKWKNCINKQEITNATITKL